MSPVRGHPLADDAAIAAVKHGATVRTAQQSAHRHYTTITVTLRIEGRNTGLPQFGAVPLEHRIHCSASRFLVRTSFLPPANPRGYTRRRFSGLRAAAGHKLALPLRVAGFVGGTWVIERIGEASEN